MGRCGVNDAIDRYTETKKDDSTEETVTLDSDLQTRRCRHAGEKNETN